MQRLLLAALEGAGCLVCAGLGLLAGRRMMAGKVAAQKERTQNLSALLAQEKVACDKWQVQAEDLQVANSELATAAGERDFYRTKFVDLEAKWRKAFPVRERLANGEFVARKKPDHPVAVAGNCGS